MKKLILFELRKIISKRLALIASMVLFVFPVLLPITEVNPLFRLVGLLPIYHVLAIWLLSVEK